MLVYEYLLVRAGVASKLGSFQHAVSHLTHPCASIYQDYVAQGTQSACAGRSQAVSASRTSLGAPVEALCRMSQLGGGLRITEQALWPSADSREGPPWGRGNAPETARPALPLPPLPVISHWDVWRASHGYVKQTFVLG